MEALWFNKDSGSEPVRSPKLSPDGRYRVVAINLRHDRYMCRVRVVECATGKTFKCRLFVYRYNWECADYVRWAADSRSVAIHAREYNHNRRGSYNGYFWHLFQVDAGPVLTWINTINRDDVTGMISPCPFDPLLESYFCYKEVQEQNDATGEVESVWALMIGSTHIRMVDDIVIPFGDRQTDEAPLHAWSPCGRALLVVSSTRETWWYCLVDGYDGRPISKMESFAHPNSIYLTHAEFSPCGALFAIQSWNHVSKVTTVMVVRANAQLEPVTAFSASIDESRIFYYSRFSWLCRGILSLKGITLTVLRRPDSSVISYMATVPGFKKHVGPRFCSLVRLLLMIRQRHGRCGGRRHLARGAMANVPLEVIDMILSFLIQPYPKNTVTTVCIGEKHSIPEGQVLAAY